jgi:hypothetical protein
MYSWSTWQAVLGWDIATISKTMMLPSQQQQERLVEVLDLILSHQKLIGITKWQKVLGELRSMSSVLPESHRQHFSSLQKTLRLHKKGKQAVILTKDIHQALQYLR